MARVVRVSNSNYKIAVQSGGQITLDTGTTSNETRSISGATQANPVVITTSVANNFYDKQRITITGVVGMTQLNDNSYYIRILTNQTFELYSDPSLATSVNGTGYGSWVSNGVVEGRFGNVVVIGNLEVQGTTTTVDSTTLTVADNIIVLTKDNISAGIPSSLGYQSGIEVERGSLQNSKLVFDEQIAWTLGGTSGQGTWTFLKGTDLLPIKTPGIVAGGNLYVSTGNGVISVTGTTDYEEKVFGYTGGTINGTVIDDDAVPNAKAVADYATYVIQNSFQAAIAEGDTKAEVYDFSVTGSESNFNIAVDGISNTNFYPNRVEFPSVKIQENEISTLDSNKDLILSASGTGSVKVKDVLSLTTPLYDDDLSNDPSAPADGIKVYSKTQAQGQTGLYFVNSNNKSGELVSKNRALLFGMLF